MEEARNGVFLSQQQQQQQQQQGYSSIDFTLLDRPMSDSAMVTPPPPSSNGHRYAGDYSAFRSSPQDHHFHGTGAEGHDNTRYMESRTGAYYNAHADFLQQKNGVRDFFNDQDSGSYAAESYESHGNNGQTHPLFLPGPQSGPSKPTLWDSPDVETRSFLQGSLADNAAIRPPSRGPFSHFHHNTMVETRHPADNGVSPSSPPLPSWHPQSRPKESVQNHRNQNGRPPPFSVGPLNTYDVSKQHNFFQEQLSNWRAGTIELGFGQEPETSRLSSSSNVKLHILAGQQQPQQQQQQQQQQEDFEAEKQMDLEPQRQQLLRQAIEVQRQQQVLEAQRQQQKAIEVQRQQQAMEAQRQQQKAFEVQRQQQAVEAQRQQQKAFEFQRQQQAMEAQRQQQNALEVQRQQQVMEAQRQQQNALDLHRQQHAMETQRQQQKALEVQRLQQQQEEEALEVQRQQQAVEAQRQQQKAFEFQRQQQAMEAQRQQQNALEVQRQQQVMEAQRQQQKALEVQRQQQAMEVQRQQQNALDLHRQQHAMETQRQQQKALEVQRLQQQQEEEALEVQRQQQQEALESQRLLQQQQQQQQQALESQRQLQQQQQQALNSQRLLQQQQQQALESQRQQKALEYQRQLQQALESQRQQKALEYEREQQEALEGQGQQQQLLEDQRQQQQQALEAQRQHQQQQQALESQRQQQQQALEAQRQQQQQALEAQWQQQQVLEAQRQQQQALEAQRYQQQQQQALEAQRQQKAMEYQRQQNAIEYQRQLALEMEKQQALDSRNQQVLEVQTREFLEGREQQQRHHQNVMLQNFQTSEAQQQAASWGQQEQALWTQRQTQQQALQERRQEESSQDLQQHRLQSQQQQPVMPVQQQQQGSESQMHKHAFVMKRQHALQSQNLRAQQQQSILEQKALQRAQLQQGSRTQNDQPQSHLGSQRQFWQAQQPQQQGFEFLQPEHHQQAQQPQNSHVQQQEQILPDYNQMVMQSHKQPTIQSQHQSSMPSQQQFRVHPEEQITLPSQQRPVSVQHFDKMFQQRPDHSKQHQMVQEQHLEFPETSYSALLHRPDTPPSQIESADQIGVSKSDQEMAFPAVNPWVVSDNFSVGQNLRRMSPGFSGDLPLVTHDVPGNAQTCSSGIQNLPDHHLHGGWRLSPNDARVAESMVLGRCAGNKESTIEAEGFGVKASADNDPHTVGQLHRNLIAMQQSEQQHRSYRASQQQTDGHGAGNVLNVDGGDKSQLHSKAPASQRMLVEDSGPRKTGNNGVHVLNSLLQSQQYFQSLQQQNQERSQSSVEQKQNNVSSHFSRLSGNDTLKSLQNNGDKIGRDVCSLDNPVLEHRGSYSPVHEKTGPEYNQNSKAIRPTSITMASAPHQDILDNRTESESRKKGTIDTSSEFSDSPSLVPGGHRPGSSSEKRDPQRYDLQRDGTLNVRSDDPQNCNGSEAPPYGPKTVGTSLHAGNDQDAARRANDKRSSDVSDANQETQQKISQNEESSQCGSNFLDVFSKQSGKLIAENQTVAMNVQNRKLLAAQNSFEGKQRQLLQQRVDPGVSLVRDRQLQPAYIPSPQHMNPGVDSNLPRTQQQSDKPGWKNLNPDELLAEDVPITSSIAGKLYYSSPYGGVAAGNSRDAQSDFYQGSDAVSKRRNLTYQSSPTPNIPSNLLLSRACLQPDVFSQSFASSQGLVTKPADSPSNVSSEVDGYSHSERESRMNDRSFSGYQLAHENPRPVGIQQKTPTRFTSQDSAGGFPGQPDHAFDGLHEMQNQRIINKALKELETREQARDALGLSMKRSHPEQPRTFGIQEKAFFGSSSDASKRSHVPILGRASNDAQTAPYSNNQSHNVLGLYSSKLRTNRDEASDSQGSVPAVRNLSSERSMSMVDSSGDSSIQGRLSASGKNNLHISNAADRPLSQSKMQQAKERDDSASAGQLLQREKRILEDAKTDITWSLRLRGLHGDSPRNDDVCLDNMNPLLARQYRSMLDPKESAQNASSLSDPVKYRPEMLKQCMDSSVASSSKENSSDAKMDRTAPFLVNNTPPSSQGLRFFVGMRDSPSNQFVQAQSIKSDSCYSSRDKVFAPIHNSLANDRVHDGSLRNRDASSLGDAVYREADDESSEKIPVMMLSTRLPLKRNSFCTEVPHPKRRKRQVPLLIPWHSTAVQPTRNNLPSIGEMEEMWANAVNRVPEKYYGNFSSPEEPLAKRRLKLTTQLLQQILLPLTCGFMNGKTHDDYECVVYAAAKLALGDACRLVTNADTEREAGFKDDGLSDSQKLCLSRPASLANAAGCMTRLMDKVKLLGEEITRVETVTTVRELEAEAHELEKMAIVNRLVGRWHDTGCTKDTVEYYLGLGNKGNDDIVGPGFFVQKPAPKKCVTVVLPIPPRTSLLLQHARCLPL